jgi:hypothetical protein
LALPSGSCWESDLPIKLSQAVQAGLVSIGESYEILLSRAESGPRKVLLGALQMIHDLRHGVARELVCTENLV